MSLQYTVLSQAFNSDACYCEGLPERYSFSRKRSENPSTQMLNTDIASIETPLLQNAQAQDQEKESITRKKSLFRRFIESCFICGCNRAPQKEETLIIS